MELKLFGKHLFTFSKSDTMLLPATNALKESKFLPDFYKEIGGISSGELWSQVETISNSTLFSSSSGGAIAIPSDAVKKVEKTEDKKEEKPKQTPKGIYNLGLLHEKTFKLNTDPKYVDEQLSSFKDKLALIKSAEYDMRRGTNEIASIVIRLENRKKYPEVKNIFEEFPYTTTSKINAVVKDHDYLKIDLVDQFMADMPKEAIDAMKKYNEGCKKLCGKQAMFYIIADKKDFKKTDKRRDPILLAQSPFGHFWQILGAWDEEMMFLEEL